MSERLIIIIGMTLLWIFLPYGITILLTGRVPDKNTQKSGIIVTKEIEGQAVSMDLEEYIVGVLAAELPTDYEYEVMKAQAVIIRTNASVNGKYFPTKNGNYFPAIFGK